MGRGYRRVEPHGRIVVDCPYCGEEAKLVKGTVIYPRRKDLAQLNFYMCENGHPRAYVGCHKRTTTPLGRLADAKLREAKSAAHSAFDPIWRVHKLMKRGDAYKWLSEQLGIERDLCHIGMFDRVTCLKVVDAATAYLQQSGRGMTESNLELCQSMLDRNNSIDEIAHAMSEHKSHQSGFRYWREMIVNEVRNGNLRA